MLRRVARAGRALHLPRNGNARIHTDSSNAGKARFGARRSDSKPVPVVLLAGGAAVLFCSYATAHPVLNDAEPKVQSWKEHSPVLAPGLAWDDEHLITIAWGSNREGLISPTTSDVASFRQPSDVPWLRDVALRDLVLHEHHGACVDARGNVYQWDGETKSPVLSLTGKDIVSVQAAPSCVFALSTSGKIYVLPSDAKTAEERKSGGGSLYWSPLSWFSNKEQNKNYGEIGTDQKLGWREKFISISAGDDHLLALTSSGRTFAHPISKDANAYGQLGFRKFTLLSQSYRDMSVELIPKAILDPCVKLTPSVIESQEATSPALQNAGTHFCDRLFEIPSLRGIKVAQAVAGARTSFVRTEGEGRVLAWGANEYGQLGLGSTLTTGIITIPTEVIFSRSAPSRTHSQCIDINTGGDLTFFTVERTDERFISSTDLLACGMGQWGGLGNGMYSTAQGNPARVRAVSGLLEFSEKTQSLQPIVPYALSISPTGHVLLTLDTLTRAGAGVPQRSGRDLLVWGANREYQLGNGKRASLATPVTLEKPGPLTGDGVGTADEGGSGGRGRLTMLRRRAKEVRDLQGQRWRTNVDVEQCAVAGWGSSLVYWRLIRN